MENNYKKVYQHIQQIIRDYLYNVSTLGNHDYFSERPSKNSRDTYYKSHGFQLLCGDSKNRYVVVEEAILEGCTRVFLINPIFKYLMEIHGIENDWKYGDTFANYSITNRSYEAGNVIEFIAVLNGITTGCTYTKNAYSSEEFAIMEHHAMFINRNKPIPGFERLSTIDRVLSIDWSGLSETELGNLNPNIPGLKKERDIISVREFFNQFFSEKEYDLIITETKKAIIEAKKIVALTAVPQLLPNNMGTFKMAVLEQFSAEKTQHIEYEYKSGQKKKLEAVISCEDIDAMRKVFHNQKRKYSIIGNSDFAKSFITAEYLFRTVANGLSIDYTSVVVGYLKSVEQLLYLFYESAFCGQRGLEYWDKCNRSQYFDISNPKYRYEPYNPQKEWKQEFYYHKKRTGEKAPEIGELILFLRYYNKCWNVSENGKELIFSCLDDYRMYCRNQHFHKDNISFKEYDTVVRIRNNTMCCLYGLLGGFKLLDSSSSEQEQLGIVNFAFEELYKNIWNKRRRLFFVKTVDGYEGLVFYINLYANTIFDESGQIVDGKLCFVKLPEYQRENAIMENILKTIENEDYVNNHSIVFSRDNMPVYIEAVSSTRLKRKEI